MPEKGACLQLPFPVRDERGRFQKSVYSVMMQFRPEMDRSGELWLTQTLIRTIWGEVGLTQNA